MTIDKPFISIIIKRKTRPLILKYSGMKRVRIKLFYLEYT